MTETVSFFKIGIGDAAINLLSLDKSITYTLNDFMDIQIQQAQQAFVKITLLRKKVIELVWESCAVSIVMT